LRRIVHPLGPLFRHLPLALRRHLLFLRHRGSWGNFRTPRGFGEKMQWRILNDHRPLLSWTADKLAQKEYVRRISASNPAVAALNVPETYWVGTDSSELRSLSPRLPQRWVFKPNHSCSRIRLFGGAASNIDWGELSTLSRLWCQADEESLVFGAWAYSQARIAVMAEERIGDGERPTELKVLCFAGKVHSIMAHEGIGSAQWQVAYYDAAFNRVTSGWQGELVPEAHDLQSLMSAPKRADLVRAAEALAAPFDFMRIDFFLHGETLWFNEFTTYSGGGLMQVGDALDLERGAQWQLPDLAAHDPRAAEWRALLEGPLRGTLQR